MAQITLKREKRTKPMSSRNSARPWKKNLESTFQNFPFDLMTNDQDDGEFAHPEAAPNKCRDAQGSGVVAEPGKVESNFQPKVLRDLACMEVEMQSKY